MHFISHSSLDKSAALDLRDRLLARGYDAPQIFLDSEDSGIAAGRKWEQVLYERLKDCRALIVLCSPHWQQSKWCFAELVYAKMAGKEVLPVVLADCDLSVASEHQAVFVNKEGEAAYARLFDALEARHLGPKDHLRWPHPDLRDVHGQLDICPFPGLPAFDERYAAVYFGRERETQVVLEELRQMRSKGEPRLLMIVGGSGSGKSSLLMAGVLPRLKHTTSRTDWLVLPTLRFGRRDYPDALFETLAEEILARYPSDAAAKGISVPDRKTLRDQFAANKAAEAAKAFLDAARELTLANGSKDATVLLPIDQFEEFLPPSGGANGEKFLKFLKQVCQHRDDRLLVIGTMRSDYLDVYERHSHALKAPTFYPWRLEPFPREQIENVIVKPATRVYVEVTPELREQLKQDTPTTDALPLLAFTLEKLYRSHAANKKLDLNEYKSLGGMEGSIRHTAEQIMPANSLPPNVESAVRLSFVKHLAQVNEKDEFVRLTARWKDLDPAAHSILNEFVAKRLLIKSERDGEATLEVAHEALFRSWDHLKSWLGTSADILRWRRDVRRDQTSDKKWHGLRPAQLAVARDWPRRRRNELSDDEVRWIKQGIRRDQIFRSGVVAIITLIATLGGLAKWQSNVAWNEKMAAVSNAANTLTDSATGRMDRGESFAAMHEFATAVYEVREQPANQTPNRVRLRFATQIVPQLVAILPHDTAAVAAQLSEDGSTLVTTDWKGRVLVWNTASLTEETVAPPKVLEDGFDGDDDHDWPFAARISGDGRVLITANDKQTLQKWDTRQFTNLTSISVPEIPYKSDLNHDGSKLVTGGVLSMTADLWDTSSGTHLFTLSVADLSEHPTHLIGAVVFDPNGRYVATTTSSGTVVWDAQDGTRLAVVKDDSQVFWAAFRPNSHQIATSTTQGVTLWDFEKVQAIHRFSGFAGIVNFVTFDRTGNWLLGLSQGDNPRLWWADSERPSAATVFNVRARASPGPGGGFPTRASFAKLESRVLTWQANTVTLWDNRTGRVVWTIQGHVGGEMTGHITDASMSSNGRFVATASSDKSVRLWRIPTPLDSCFERRDVKAIRDEAAFFSDELVTKQSSWKTSDGSAASADCIQAAKLQRPVEQRTSPDGKLEIVIVKDLTLDVVETKTKTVISSLWGHQNVIHGAEFDGLGTQIASFSSGDHTARVWRRDKGGRFSLAFVFPQEGVCGTAFDPDCNLLATAAYDDNSVGVWNLRGGRLVVRLIGNYGFDQNSSCIFDAQGRLVTAFSKFESRNADYTEGNTTYSQPIPDDRLIEIWDTKPLIVDPDLIRTWVEVYTGTKWAPNLPGGVDGLSADEWNERRDILNSALGAKRD